MNRKTFITILIVLLFAIQPVFGEDADPEIPGWLLNNQYYRESIRLSKLAQETYDFGDYDASAGFAEEAIRNAQLSNDYIILQLKIKEADDAIAAAKKRLDWATANNAATRYPIEFNQSKSYYDDSLTARKNEQWDEAILAANRVIELLAYMEGEGPAPGGAAPLPKQYTVRAWADFRDCLWNIAGYPWVYGQPEKWRLLYDANKSQISDPDVIEPGMVLDIPSIKGEARDGMWDSGKIYSKP